MYNGAEWTREQSLELLTEQIEARAQEQERRRKPMDVLNVLDVCVKENNMVVKKTSREKNRCGERGERRKVD